MPDLRSAVRAIGAGPLAEPQFRLLFAGQAISAFGDRVVPVALAFAVLDLTGSAADLGLVLAAQTVAFVAFVLVGGVWADRLPRHRVMLASDVVRGAAEASIAALLLTGSARLWHLVALQAVYGAANAFFQPASTGLVPQTVSPPRLQQANALLRLSVSGTAIVGPAVSGVLVTTVGAGWALALDAATFGVSAWSLLLLRPRGRVAAASQAFLADLAAGWREVVARRWLWVSVLNFTFFQTIALASFFVLGPFVAKESLGGAKAWAAILTAAGAGSLAGGLVALRFRPRRLLRAAFALMLLWVPQLAFLALELPTPAIAAAALLGAFGLTQASVLWATALQQHVAPESLSRVSAYDWLGSVAFMPVGYALVGPLADRIGTATMLWLAAGWVAVSCGSTLAVGAVRRLGRVDGDDAVTLGEPPTQVVNA